jgi:hypothetical protein
MNLKVICTAFFAFTISCSYAETKTPDILSSISPSSVQYLSTTESSEVKGEYRYCSSYGLGCLPVTWSSTKPIQKAGYYIQSYGQYLGYYVSRKN